MPAPEIDHDRLRAALLVGELLLELDKERPFNPSRKLMARVRDYLGDPETYSERSETAG